MYKDDWGVQKPRIMQKHGWEACPGEVLISTPRRFGKTFRHALPCPVLVPAPAPTNTGFCERSIAIFCACFLLTQKAEIVVFRQT